MHHYLLLEGLAEVLDEIVNVLDAHREADHVVIDAEEHALLLRYAGVRHDRGALDQGLHSAEGLREGPQLEGLEEVSGFGEVASEVKGDHGAESRLLGARKLVLGVRLETGVDDSRDLGVGLEILRHLHGVALRGLHAHVEGLKATNSHVAVERSGDGANAVLNEAHLLPDLHVAADDDAHEHVGVAADVLGDAVQHEIGAELKRTLQVRSHEGVVHDQKSVVLLRDLSDGADVGDLERGVRGRLDPDETGLGGEGLLVHSHVGHVDEGEVQAVLGLSDAAEESLGAAVDVIDAHDVVAGLQHLDDGVRRRQTRSWY